MTDMGNRTENKKKKKRRIIFTAGLIAAVFGAVILAVFAGTGIYRTLKDYFRYSSMQGTGVILEEQGLNGLFEWITEENDVPEIINISYLELELAESGEIYDFTLSLQEFDAEKEYIQDVRFWYDSTTGELGRQEETVTAPAAVYDPNAEPGYLDQQIKQIPFNREMDVLDFDQYVVRFMKDRKPEAGAPVIDGTDGMGFPVLTWEEYRQGAGGVSDGSSQVIFSLTDGTGTTGRSVDYSFPPADEDALAGSPETVMQTDYKFEGEDLMLTDDQGETWVSAGLTSAQIQETLDTYQKGQILPEESFCSDGNGMFAVFYGQDPVLHLSRDGGDTWEDISFSLEFPRACIARTIEFLDSENWYAGLGTDWSMGTGGAAYVCWTHDGGATWTTVSVGDTDGKILNGLVFTDTENGLMSMEDLYGDGQWPHIYVTGDGGKSYTEIGLPWDTLPDDVTFLNKIDSLVYENGIYTLTLGQGEYGNKKAEFTSSSPGEGWTYQDSYTGTTHTWG